MVVLVVVGVTVARIAQTHSSQKVIYSEVESFVCVAAQFVVVVG